MTLRSLLCTCLAVALLALPARAEDAIFVHLRAIDAELEKARPLLDEVERRIGDSDLAKSEMKKVRALYAGHVADRNEAQRTAKLAVRRFVEYEEAIAKHGRNVSEYRSLCRGRRRPRGCAKALAALDKDQLNLDRRRTQLAKANRSLRSAIRSLHATIKRFRQLLETAIKVNEESQADTAALARAHATAPQKETLGHAHRAFLGADEEPTDASSADEAPVQTPALSGGEPARARAVERSPKRAARRPRRRVTRRFGAFCWPRCCPAPRR